MSSVTSALLLASSSSSSSSSSTGPFSLDGELESWYKYTPVVGLAVAAFTCFFILSICLWYQSLRYLHGRYWYTLALPIAATLEMVGYIARYMTTQGVNDSNDDLFVLQVALILVVPNVFAFTNYATVGRILELLTPQSAQPTCWRVPIITDSTGAFRAGRIAGFFFLSDIFSLIIQIAAVPFLTSSDKSKVNQGQTIIEIGLGWALGFVALFWIITIYIFRSPRYQVRSHPQYLIFRRMFGTLFITIGCLTIRSLYRLIDYADGYTGYLNTHEAFFYVFDTLLILLACVAYVSTPFGYFLNKINELMVQVGVKSAKGEAEMGQMDGHKVVVVSDGDAMALRTITTEPSTSAQTIDQSSISGEDY